MGPRAPIDHKDTKVTKGENADLGHRAGASHYEGLRSGQTCGIVDLGAGEHQGSGGDYAALAWSNRDAPCRISGPCGTAPGSLFAAESHRESCVVTIG